MGQARLSERHLTLVSHVGSQAGRNQQRGNGRSRKDKHLCHLDSDGNLIDMNKWSLQIFFNAAKHKAVKALWGMVTSQWIVTKKRTNIMYCRALTHVLLSVVQTAGLLCYTLHKAKCFSVCLFREKQSQSLCGIKMLTLLGARQKRPDMRSVSGVDRNLLSLKRNWLYLQTIHLVICLWAH